VARGTTAELSLMGQMARPGQMYAALIFICILPPCAPAKGPLAPGTSQRDRVQDEDNYQARAAPHME
jgi:hypothetical protein